MFSMLVVGLLVLPMVAAQASETWLTNSAFYNKVAVPYIVPSGMSGLAGVIVGIVTIIILLVIFADVLEIFAPFSEWANWTIAVGLGIIAVVIKLNVTVAGWIFKIGSIAFAWAGAAAVFLNIVLAILILWFIFVGGQWIQKWATGIRNRRQEIRSGTGTSEAKSGLRVLRGVGKESTKPTP